MTETENSKDLDKKLNLAVEIGQNLMGVCYERCGDLGIPPKMAALIMYELTRENVRRNIQTGKMPCELIKINRMHFKRLFPMAERIFGSVAEDGTFEENG